MITYDKYDKEIREAHLEIGKLKEQLRVAVERADRYAEDSRRLRTAEDILSEKDLLWCEGCESYTDSFYHEEKKAGWDGPSEGVQVCYSCDYVKDRG